VLPGSHRARQPTAGCQGAVRYAPEAAACQLLRAAVEVWLRRPAALPEQVRFEPVLPLRAAWQGEAASGRARPSLAADPVQHPPAALACRAQARPQPEASARLAVSQRRAASWRAEAREALQASPDEAAAGVRQPGAPAGAEEPRQEAAVQQGGAAAERQPAAARAVAGVRRRAVVAAQDEAAAGLQPEVVPDAAGVRQPEAPDVPAAAQPSVVPSVCRRDQLPPWPVPAPAAHPAHAMRGRRMA
jgi:hypothetical protein